MILYVLRILIASYFHSNPFLKQQSSDESHFSNIVIDFITGLGNMKITVYWCIYTVAITNLYEVTVYVTSFAHFVHLSMVYYYMYYMPLQQCYWQFSMIYCLLQPFLFFCTISFCCTYYFSSSFPLTGGILLWVVSLYGRCPLMGGVLLWKVLCCGRCPLVGGVLLWKVSSCGRCPLMESALLWKVSSYGRSILLIILCL